MPEVMANRDKWPQLGVQPQNLHEHATQLIAEATALLALDRGQRQKLPDRLFESFIESIQTYARKTREQPSAQEILDKLNQIHHLTKSTLIEDITLIKNAVNHAATNPTSRIPTWAERVRTGGPPSHPPTPPSTATTSSSKEREIIVKLDSPESAALLRQKTPEELRRTINDVLQQMPNSNATIRIVAARQLKSGDIAIHTANTADAKFLKDNTGTWVSTLGSRARVLKPTYGILAHGVRTDKENIDPNRQAASIEKIQTENATLHPGAEIAYIGWLTKNGATKTASSLVVEFATKEQANRAIREGLVLGACQHDCELYDRSGKLKQCFRCQRYGHIVTQCSANDTCGQCAEPHNTRQCRKKEEDPNFTPKCALCKGPHTAWSSLCQIRQVQLAKIEQARRNRPSFYYSATILEPTLHVPTFSSNTSSAQFRRGNQEDSAPPSTRVTAPPLRKRPVERQEEVNPRASQAERRVLRPRTSQQTRSRSQPQPGAFYNFTPNDTDVFIYNKHDLEKAIEERAREMQHETEKTSRESNPQDLPIDPRLLDPNFTDSQIMVIDE